MKGKHCVGSLYWKPISSCSSSWPAAVSMHGLMGTACVLSVLLDLSAAAANTHTCIATCTNRMPRPQQDPSAHRSLRHTRTYYTDYLRAHAHAHKATHSHLFWCHDHPFQRKADRWATNTKVQWLHIDCSQGSIPGYFDISLPQKETTSVNAGVS